VRADAPVLGRFDRARIEQALTNLLANAIKYAPGTRVEVAVAQRGHWAELTVADEGIGIAGEELPRIFDRFARAVPAEHYGGLGLGLFISRQIVDAHGGTIAAESAPGRGATFTVRLPLAPADGASET
jgi:signal transduction histidine kinase